MILVVQVGRGQNDVSHRRRLKQKVPGVVLRANAQKGGGSLLRKMKCDPEIFIIAAEEGVAVTVLQINGDAVPYTRAVGMNSLPATSAARNPAGPVNSIWVWPLEK